MSKWKNRIDLREADKIRRMREQGIGYKTIAQRTGMTLSHVQAICKGSRPVWWRPLTQEKIVRAVKKFGKATVMKKLKVCEMTIDIALGKTF